MRGIQLEIEKRIPMVVLRHQAQVTNEICGGVFSLQGILFEDIRYSINDLLSFYQPAPIAPCLDGKKDVRGL